MGIDLGTSSVKTIITDITGKIKAKASETYDIIMPKTGYTEQCGESLWRATSYTIRKAITESGLASSEIAAIGLSGQMHGLVPLDKNKRLIRPIIIWMDQRSRDEKLSLEHNALFKDITLNAPGTGFYVTSLLWMRKHEPDLFKQIRYALLPKDYIRYQLCGEIGTDYSDASGTLIFDTANRRWAYDLATQLNFDHAIFPSCHSPIELAGYVTHACADKTGLMPGTPIIFGGGDQPMHSVGNGIVSQGVVSSNIGTACQISAVTNRVIIDPLYRLNTFCHIPDDMWTIVGAGLNGGNVLKWLQNNILHLHDYRAVDQCASVVDPGSNKLIFLPYLSGERTPHMDPNARGIFFGLTLSHTDKHLVRAVMEGIIFSLRESLELFYDLGIDCTKIIASGGGVRSKIWLQIQADILEKEIVTTCCEEQACLGAAITAGVGIGLFNSIGEASKTLVHYSPDVTEPNSSRFDMYREQFHKYQALYRQNKKLF